ncbi:unnamed protein product [Chrysoparadoxa australica]
MEVDPTAFLSRLQRLKAAWGKGSPQWGNATALAFCGNRDDDQSYAKSIALQVHLLGYDFGDVVMLLTQEGQFFIVTTKKKCRMLESAKAAAEKEGGGITINLLEKVKGEAGQVEHYDTMLKALKAGGGTPIMGNFEKEKFVGDMASGWLSYVKSQGIETVDITLAVGLVLAVKIGDELDLMKKAAILSNKVMKYGFQEKMGDVIENEEKVKHSKLATDIDAILENPSLIKIKVPPDDVEPSFFPIIMSGGSYDLKPSAESNSKIMQFDVIICTLGARYKSYCGNLSRTYFINPPPTAEATYQSLLTLYNETLAKLRPGTVIKEVVEFAHGWLKKKAPHLLPHLTKSLGFGLGLDFKEKALDLTLKNHNKLREGMSINLSIGLSDVPLSASDLKKSNWSIDKFSCVIADTVVVKKDDNPEILTRCSKEWRDVGYSMDFEGDGDGDGDGGDDEEEGVVGKPKQALGGGVMLNRKLRDRGNVAEVQAQMAQRQERMKELLKKKAALKAAQLAKAHNNEEDSEEEQVEELKAYSAPDQYPRDTMPNQIKVDMDSEVVLLPVNGRPVPFAIHTIKNVVMPEPDSHSYYLRINFFAPGQALGKEASRLMAKLVDKYAVEMMFVKELTYRSLDQTNLSQAFRQIQELRKRLKLREQKAAQEADLVVQAKLVKMTDMKIPRLSDLILRPNIQGKTTGSLEAHVNGLRFSSNKHGTIDILYANIKHAFFQPCKGNDTKVVLHFHLKHKIIVGKAAHRDVSVHTEAVDSTVNLDGARRSHYDPDEIMEEQRDRQLRKRLNQAFEDFSQKVTKVAKNHGHDLEFDVPFKELGFYGNPSTGKDMVFVQPTTYALINVTDSPAFVVSMSEVEHVHFERVNPNGKNFDMRIVVSANMSESGGLAEPRGVGMIEMKYLNPIMSWLEDCNITFTKGPSLNWKQVLALVRDDLHFYEDTDENGDPKPAGWAFLAEDSGGEEEEEDAESEFEAGDESEEEESEDDDESFDEVEEDESEASELEDEGEDWDEMERRAAADDKAKRDWDGRDGNFGARKKQRRH